MMPFGVTANAVLDGALYSADVKCTDLTSTLTLWMLGIVKSQRHLTPGSYLSTFMALSAVWVTSHTSKVEHKKKEKKLKSKPN